MHPEIFKLVYRIQKDRKSAIICLNWPDIG